MEKIPYTQTLKARSEAPGTYYIRDNKVDSGWWLFVQHFACKDIETAPSKIIVGRGKDEAIDHPFEEEGAPAVDTWYHSEKPLYFVPEGERMIAEFQTTVLNDQLRFVIDGYLTPKRLSDKVEPLKKLEVPAEG